MLARAIPASEGRADREDYRLWLGPSRLRHSRRCTSRDLMRSTASQTEEDGER
jgi:hypothetical protein